MADDGAIVNMLLFNHQVHPSLVCILMASTCAIDAVLIVVFFSKSSEQKKGYKKRTKLKMFLVVSDVVC